MSKTINTTDPKISEHFRKMAEKSWEARKAKILAKNTQQKKDSVKG